MNYLDMVNSVLRRLREEPVSSLYENRQSSVVAEFINDAKREVEDAHDWSAYRTDLTIGTSAGITNYRLIGSSNRATVIDVRNITSNSMLTRVTSDFIRRQDIIQNPGQTKPSYWALEGMDAASGDSKIRLWPTPDDNYSIKIHCVLRPDELQAEGDQVTIPSKPIVLLAWAMSAMERGDVDAGDVQSAAQLAKNALADAIMYDAAKNPDEQIWYPV
jgi:hypothetical protein